MNNKKLIPISICGILAVAVIALSASNAMLRRDLAAARDAQEPADTNAVANASDVGELFKTAVKAAADTAIDRLGRQPLAAISANPYTEWGKMYVKVVFQPDDGISPPKGGNAFSIEPKVDNAKLSVGYDGVRLAGDFVPDETYTLTLNPGWRGENGRVLEKPARLTFKGPRVTPYFSFEMDDRCYWPASRTALKLPFSSLAITNLHVTVSRAYGSNIPLFGCTDWYQKYKSKQVAEFDVPLPFVEKQRGKLPGLLDLGAALDKPEPGIYFVTVDPEAAYQNDRYWRYKGEFSLTVALTDLAVSANVEAGDGNAIVFVNSFGDGAPVADAKVTLMTAKHQVAATGATGKDGIARLVAAVDADDSVKFAVVGKDGDISSLDLDPDYSWRGAKLYEGDGSGLRESSKISAFVFSEREICRPGEKFSSSVFVRTAPKDGAKAMSGAPVVFSLVDARRKTVGRKRVTADSLGYASVEWEIPANAELGVWRVQCDVGDSVNAGSLRMSVANYVPDRFKTELALPEKDIVGLGAGIPISGKAAYYFGEPLSEGFCKLTAEAVYAPTPKHLRGWKFGGDADFEKWKTWTSSLTLGDDGTFSAEFPGLSSNGIVSAYAPLSFVVAADVQEPGGASVSASGRVVVHPTPAYIALKGKEDGVPVFDIALKPAVEGAGTDNDKPVKVAISLEREEWTRRFVKNDNGMLSVEWESKMVKVEGADRTVEIPAGAISGGWLGLVDYSGGSLESGCYRLTATDGGAMKTVFDFWHWFGATSERSSNPNNIILEAGAPSYAPGEAAVISFVSPFDGSAYVVSGAAGIEDSFAASVTQGLNKVSLLIPPAMLSAKYNVAVTVISAGAGEPRRVSGVVGLDVDCSSSRRMKVSLELPELARPDSDMEFGVSLSDAGGAPVSGRVAVVALDEGTAALTDFHVADPFKYFFARKYGRPFSVFDCYNLVFPQLRIMPDGTFGGDEIEQGAAARNVAESQIMEKATVRFVLPPVDVGTNGHAVVKARLPDHSGALRIMAVAADELRAGSGEETLVVRAPVSVQASAPRFATGGDAFLFTAMLFNHDAEPGDASLRVSLPEGISAADDGSAELAFASPGLAPGKSVVFQRELKISDAASGALEIGAAMSLGASSSRDSAIVNVRPARPVETVSSLTAVTNGAASFPGDAAAWIGKAETTLALSATPAAALASSLAWLGEYPYGCLEQTVSCAFPFVAAVDLEKLGLIDGAVREGAAAKVALAYALVLQLRRNNGYMSMWPWLNETWRAGSLYAAHFIFEAEKAGMLDVEERVRKMLLDMLRGEAEDASPENRENSAYAAYALAVAGDVSFVNAARNVVSQGKGDWPAYLAAAAMLRGGFASEGVGPFASAALARAWESGGDGDRVKNAGLALFIAAKSGIDDIAALAPAASLLLSSLRSDGSAWGTTRDNAWATLGLAAYSARFGAAAAKGSVTIGGESRPFDLGKGPATFKIPFGADVSVESDAPFFALRTSVGIPAESPAGNGPILISRRYMDGAGKEVESVARGDLVTAVIEVRSSFDIEDAVIVDMVPGGFEIEDAMLKTRSTLGAYTLPANTPQLDGKSEKRNDRWIWYGDITGGKTYSVTFNLRAVTPGRFAMPSASVEAMYSPDAFGRAVPARGDVIEVR